MPKIKRLTPPKPPPVYSRLGDWLAGQMRFRHIPASEMAVYARCSKSSFYLRISKPEGFRLSELEGIAARLGMTITELIAKVESEVANR